MRALVILFFLLVLALGAFFATTYNRWEGSPPEIRLDHDFKALGRSPSLQLTVADAGTGLKHTVIRLKQGGKETVLAEDSFERAKAEKSRTYDLGKMFSEKGQLQQGQATLVVEASDHAYRNLLKGNHAELTKSFDFDALPPRVEVLSTQHYINQGGSECVVYRVSDDAVTSGVQVGPHFFPGFPVNPTDKRTRFALFALEYDLPADTAMKVVAHDAAGNEATADFWKKVFPKGFRSRDIPIDDAFLQKVVPDVVSNTPEVKDQGDLVKTFVEINSHLRKQNHQKIADLAKESEGKFLWNGAFLQLSNSKVESSFADRRSYIYKGQKIDQQDHVGFDLSVVQHNPIEAANDGKVIHAGRLGIYGNTVLIDHGAGLITLYGHMSSIDVKPGQMVKKKDILGKSGATGLAAGDHLHFGMFLQGVPINPTEWWDGKWIKDHVLDRLPTS
jgi:murein DD-endopeptidase MepM/ murein hydrolase activator NlpD